MKCSVYERLAAALMLACAWIAAALSNAQRRNVGQRADHQRLIGNRVAPTIVLHHIIADTIQHPSLYHHARDLVQVLHSEITHLTEGRELNPSADGKFWRGKHDDI